MIEIDAWQRIKALGKERSYANREVINDVLRILMPEFKAGDFVVTTNSLTDHAYIGEPPHQTIWVVVVGEPLRFTAIDLANNREGQWRYTDGRHYASHPYLDGEEPPRFPSAAEMAFLRGD